MNSRSHPGTNMCSSDVDRKQEYLGSSIIIFLILLLNQAEMIPTLILGSRGIEKAV